MRDNQQNYKYQSDRDLWNQFVDDFTDYFSPLFKSYENSPKTFILQIVNFVLVFLFLNFWFTNLIDSILTKVSGSGIMAMRILILIILTGVISAIKSNKIFRWQTLFEMKHVLAKIWFKRLVVANVAIYSYAHLLHKQAKTK